jgi:hypothetical protein
MTEIKKMYSAIDANELVDLVSNYKVYGYFGDSVDKVLGAASRGELKLLTGILESNRRDRFEGDRVLYTLFGLAVVIEEIDVTKEVVRL